MKLSCFRARLWIAGAICLASCLGSALAEDRADDGTTGGPELNLSITAQSMYLQPGPIIFRLEMRSAPGVESAALKNGLPVALNQGPVSLIYTLAKVEGEGEPLVWVKAEPSPASPIWGEPWTLSECQGANMLVDLTDVRLFVNDPFAGAPSVLEPGKYRFAVQYTETGGDRSNEVQFEIMPARATDSAFLMSRANGYWQDNKDTTWCNIMVHCADPSTLAGLSDGMKRQALPYLLFNEVFHASRMDAVAGTKLDAMAGTLFEPESNAWRYELLQARGQHGDAATVREEIEAKHPGLLWLLNRIDRGAELRLAWEVGSISTALGR